MVSGLELDMVYLRADYLSILRISSSVKDAPAVRTLDSEGAQESGIPWNLHLAQDVRTLSASVS